jgi:hypothetical protein
VLVGPYVHGYSSEISLRRHKLGNGLFPPLDLTMLISVYRTKSTFTSYKAPPTRARGGVTAAETPPVPGVEPPVTRGLGTGGQNQLEQWPEDDSVRISASDTRLSLLRITRDGACGLTRCLAPLSFDTTGATTGLRSLCKFTATPPSRRDTPARDDGPARGGRRRDQRQPRTGRSRR